jgi:cation transport ATPase
MPSPRPDLRASDADRERVAVFLRDQAAVGRLTHEELEERVDRAYHAVTLGELERLIRDLPRAQAPVRRGPNRRASRALIPLGVGTVLAFSAPMVLFVTAAVVLAVGVALLAMVFALGMALGPFILVALLIVAITRRRRPARHWHPRYY